MNLFSGLKGEALRDPSVDKTDGQQTWVIDPDDPLWNLESSLKESNEEGQEAPKD